MPETAAISRASIGQRWDVLVALALVACYLTLGLSASRQKSQTGDEGAHLTGGFSYWAENDYRVQNENGNWPQRLCGLPVWLSGYQFPSLDAPEWRDHRQWDLVDRFFYDCGNDVDGMLLRGRVMTALLGVALAAVVSLWSRRLFGAFGGLISLALFAFSPSMLTHGFLITSDMAAALFFTAAVGSLWMLLHRVSWGTLAATWFTLSGLFLSKFSAPLVVPMAAVMLGVRLWSAEPLVLAIAGKREVRSRARQVAVFAALTPILVAGVALSIWASYGFRYSMIRPDLTTVRPVPWQEVETKSELTNRVVDFARQHELLPEAYLFGFSHVMRWSEARNAFFNGEFRRYGWWGFFPYCLAVKTPLEVFVLLASAAAAIFYFRDRTRKASSGTPRRPLGGLYDLVPLVALLAVYWPAALVSHLNIGHRHLLPTYPAMFVLAGAAAWWLQPPTGASAPTANRRSKRDGERPTNRLIPFMRVVAVGALVVSGGEALWFWPHYLAYFNLLAGGPRHGYQHLVDSSLDWSQDLKGVKPWLDAHPLDAGNERRLYFSFYGSPPPEYYGIHAQRLPSFPDRWKPQVPEPLAGGTYLVSATMLQAVALSQPGRWNKEFEDQYRQLRQNVAAFRELWQTSEGQKQLLEAAPAQTWNGIFWTFETLRFSRLASYLRHREPDDEIGYSILVYRLSDADVRQALDGPPKELLPLSEIRAEDIRLGLTDRSAK